jgi:excisionase family DNA binding protein
MAYLSCLKAAEILGVSRATMYRLVASGAIPSTDFGSGLPRVLRPFRIGIDEADLKAYMDAHRIEIAS